MIPKRLFTPKHRASKGNQPYGLEFRFEFEPKDKSVTIRISAGLLNAIKKKAEKAGVDYQKYIRMKLEHSIFDDAA